MVNYLCQDNYCTQSQGRLNLVGNALLYLTFGQSARTPRRIRSWMAVKGDVLRQLLEELLSSADDTAPVGHGASEEVLDINNQLIELIVNAGLMTLTQRPLDSMSSADHLIY